MKSTELNDFSKRLLMLMQHGMRIEVQDGHRWLIFHETDCPGPFEYPGGEVEDFEGMLSVYHAKTGKLFPQSKFYDGPDEALDVVDAALVELGLPNLLDGFHAMYGGDWKLAWGMEDWDERKKP